VPGGLDWPDGPLPGVPGAAARAAAAGAAAARGPWRRTRPFWGGALVTAGAAATLLSEKAPLPLMIHIGVQGMAGYLVPVIQLLCGLLLWFHPAQKTFYSILAVLLALGSWITSNLGGFFIGMLLGVAGGSLAFAWEPLGHPPAPRPAPRPPRPQPPPPPPPLPPTAGLSIIRNPPEPEPEPQPKPEPGPGREQAPKPGTRWSPRRTRRPGNGVLAPLSTPPSAHGTTR
jgi:hypothetical protein